MVDEDKDFPKPKRAKKELRKYPKMPIWICENHDEVLYYIHRAIASKHIAYEGVTVLHFDSHPDLTVPVKMKGRTVFEQEKLYEEISIADWILPAVFAGHINKVIWVKPPWSDQIKEGVFHLKVGQHKETGFIRVTCPETYFVEELLYADEASLENCKDLELIVFTLEPGSKEIKEHTAALEKENKVSKALDVENNENKVAKVRDHKQSKDAFESLLPSGKSTALENNFILDIDMDFFSTQNPFKLLYTDEEFLWLRDIYRFEEPLSTSREDLESCVTLRKAQVEKIEATYSYLQHQSSPGSEEKLCIETSPECCLNQDLVKLIEMIKSHKREEPDYEMLHFSGMSADIPHHVSSSEMIDSLMQSMAAMLKCFPKPTFITMARSSYDEYTPSDQIEHIQSSLLRVMSSLYGEDIAANKCYQ